MSRRGPNLIETLGWPALLLTIIAAATSLWFARVPVPGASTDEMVAVALVVVAVLWVFVYATTPRERRVRATSFAWAMPLTLLVLGVWFLLLLSDVPMRVAFACSRPQLERAAGTFEASGRPSLPRWIGAYRVRHTEGVEADIRFTLNDRGGAWVGFARTTSPPDPKFEPVRLIPLGGDWYFVTQLRD